MAAASDVEAQTPHASSSASSSAESRQDRVSRSYKLGDVESLVKLHEEIDLNRVPGHAELAVDAGGDYVKAFVFGGLDGIVSTFALVSGLGGAQVAMGQLIAVSLAKVLADGFSMGFGEFTSAAAELEHARQLRARELWETEHHADGEVKEMCEIYMRRGCEKEDALTMLTVMAKYRDLFVDHMLMMEHGVMPPEGSDRWTPLKQGLVCFLAFICFGLVPLVGFLALHATQGSAVESSGNVLCIAYGLTAVTLFSMGLIKARLTGNGHYFQSGAMMVINGTVAGGSAYLIGQALAACFGDSAPEGV